MPFLSLQEYLEQQAEANLELRHETQADLVENFEQLISDAENAMPALME